MKSEPAEEALPSPGSPGKREASLSRNESGPHLLLPPSRKYPGSANGAASTQESELSKQRRRCSDTGSVFCEEITYTRNGSVDMSSMNLDELHKKPRRANKGGMSKEKRVTMTLFAISILYIIANLPSTLLEFIVWYHKDVLHSQHWLVPNLERFSYLLYLIYFDLNPFIYFGSNTFYRAHVLAMLRDPVSIFWLDDTRRRQWSQR